MRSVSVLLRKINTLILYFVIYSAIGWCIETVYMSFSRGFFVKRGFLIGPFCPIYGFGAILLIIFLKPIRHNIFLLFIGAVVLTSALEYMTGFFIEVLFHQNSWWDYYGEPFNISGRICLKTSIYWGLFSLIMMYLLHPLISYSTRRIPHNYSVLLSYIFVVFFVFDFVIVASSLNGYHIDFTWLTHLPSKIISNIYETFL